MRTLLSRSYKLAALLALADAGIALVGTLVGAIAVQTRARDLLVPLIALPLLIPVVIAAARPPRRSSSRPVHGAWRCAGCSCSGSMI